MVARSNTNNPYSEVDGMELLLKYRCLNAGHCKILLHPTWGASVYPASMFTHAPLSVIRETLETTMGIQI